MAVGGKIHCKKCSKYLGEIRDGTLHKDISYLCPKCERQRVALELMRKNRGQSNPFGGIFGG